MALIAIIVAYLWQDIGYNLVIFASRAAVDPDSVKDAARVDGASTWPDVPLHHPAAAQADDPVGVGAHDDLVVPGVRSVPGDDERGPDDQTRALSLDIYESAFRYQRMGWAAAVSVVLFLLVLTISLVQSRFLKANWEY